MRSRHADAFNHDPWASNYDRKVRDETNPIRTGYAALLTWLVEQARIGANACVLDLGTGTGNSAAVVPHAARIVCVDVSAKMLAQAPPKLRHIPEVEIIEADLLEVFDRDLPPFDAVISAYAVHHLTTHEKGLLFERVFPVLRPGGRIAFGDLMFESEASKTEIARAWSGDERALVVRSLDEEYPWFLDRALGQLEDAGFQALETKRFSTLSWGIAGTRP